MTTPDTGPPKAAPAPKKAAPDPYAAGPDSDDEPGAKGGRGKRGGAKSKGRRCARLAGAAGDAHAHNPTSVLLCQPQHSLQRGLNGSLHGHTRSSLPSLRPM